jgi:hypothetical protein
MHIMAFFVQVVLLVASAATDRLAAAKEQLEAEVREKDSTIAGLKEELAGVVAAGATPSTMAHPKRGTSGG